MRWPPARGPRHDQRSVPHAVAMTEPFTVPRLAGRWYTLEGAAEFMNVPMHTARNLTLSLHCEQNPNNKRAFIYRERDIINVRNHREAKRAKHRAACIAKAEGRTPQHVVGKSGDNSGDKPVYKPHPSAQAAMARMTFVDK